MLLVGGFLLAGSLTPGGFDQVAGTISDLAARDAAHPKVMTTALAGLGVCHLLTAAALRPARLPGRAVLAVGGLASIGVAAAPLPAGGGTSAVHGVAAATAFAALALWPALAWRPSRPGTPTPRHDVPAGALPAPDRLGLLRPVPSLVAAGALLGLTAWFAVELRADRGLVGASERAAAVAQALWPLAVVVSLRRPTGPSPQE